MSDDVVQFPRTISDNPTISANMGLIEAVSATIRAVEEIALVAERSELSAYTKQRMALNVKALYANVLKILALINEDASYSRNVRAELNRVIKDLKKPVPGKARR